MTARSLHPLFFFWDGGYSLRRRSSAGDKGRDAPAPPGACAGRGVTDRWRLWLGQRNDLERRRLGFQPNGHRTGPPSSLAHADTDATTAYPETDTATYPETDAAANPETDTAANASSYSRANPESDPAADGHTRTDGVGDARRPPRWHGPTWAGRPAGRRGRYRRAALCR